MQGVTLNQAAVFYMEVLILGTIFMFVQCFSLYMGGVGRVKMSVTFFPLGVKERRYH